MAASATAAGDIAHDLQTLVTEVAWGDVWTREGLDRRSRSIMTIGMLLALNRSAELKAHVIGALNNGLSIDELREMILHAAVYCGFPAALEGMRVLRETWRERESGSDPVSYFHGEFADR
ncbi:carboxymuconolactone decarboxylase family protein [Sphingomonas abietis]|uniref:Carboxymuconolactone decarboxylase family protein n=1 Tax=Sphingomonas abietis TaxID=3012344 RepID=A0ABY7NJ30_9SPHN|nr:carboxymuconolactone decarboxylase family protein [Sphingomonas abietis]WBO21333.1 carboxymuconolactone decarboxylase family protein [Sphingomonas abietis]